MSRNQYLCGASIAVFAVLGFGAHARAAAPAPEPVSPNEIVVTGSHIAGTPENAAMPVTVLSADTLMKQGSPSVVELIKQLPESSGIIGESNQFTGGNRGQGAYGQGTINLRGLGPERTLVLFNGHRLPLAGAFAVDTVTLPLSAIGRVEVLKDGAATIYGSDAIGGVVNFITKRNINGLDIGGDYRFINGSKGGDYRFDATWGRVFDRWNFMISGGYQHRSELPINSKDYAHQPYDFNPEGGWTGGGNPEAFIPAGLNGAGKLVFIGGSRLDVGCSALGGQLTGAPATPKPPPLLNWNSCRGQFSTWDNLEEKTNSYQVYSEANFALGGSHKLHIEGNYSFTDIPFFKSSPSYVTTRTVTATVLPANDGAPFVAGTSPSASFFYFVPAANPGFAAYIAANPGQFPAATQGAFMTIGTFRPYLQGGNPLYNYEHGVGGRYYHEQINLSATLKGDVTPAIHYEASLTYGSYRTFAEGRDSLTDRLELALRGLGGPGCDYTTGTPGVGGCQWLNPFSNAIPGAPKQGLTNPGYNPAVANTAALADWIMPIQTARTKSEDIEGDFTLSGKLPFALWGGPIGWAAGGQWRHNHYVTEYSQWASSVAAPCADSALPGGSNICTPATGANVFGPISNPVNLSQDIFAGYAELNLPVSDSLVLDASARYEDYGAQGGSTFNPQIRGKWQVVPFFAVRASVGTTFRAPPQGFLIPDPSTSLQSVKGTFIPVNVVGNPKLVPETALTYSVGGIFEVGHHLKASIDYWNYDFKKIITTEPLSSVVGALNCASTDAAVVAFIASHFTFSSPTCDATRIVAVDLQRINGPSVTTNGIDFNASYRFDQVVGGNLTAGVQGSHVMHYTVAAFSIAGVPIPGFEAAGKYNFGTVAYPIPQWKGQLYLDYQRGGLNIRWTARYTSAYDDQRAALFLANPIYVTPTNPSGINTRGQSIGAQVVHDVALQIPLKWKATLNVAVTNLFDSDPPFARTEINYDALTADPLGRTVKVGVRAAF